MDNRQQRQSNDSNSNNNKPPNVKAIQAYELYNKGKKSVEIAILLGPSGRKQLDTTEYLKLK